MSLKSKHKKWLKKEFASGVMFDEPMAMHTSLRVGGPASAYIKPETIKDLKKLVGWAQNNSIDYFVKGDGTNLLVTDLGISGIIIDTICFNQISIEPSKDKRAHITAMAGVKLSTLCNFAKKNGCSGLSFALGIPGTVGGSIYGNAGTSLGSIDKVLSSITVLWASGVVGTIDKKNMEFSYRRFSLKEDVNKGLRNEFVIIDGCFKLNISNDKVQNEKIEKLLALRKDRQPKGVFSAGSFFKNLEHEKSAGELIELAGLKGKRIGDAQVSEKHANFIINLGQSTSSQILELMKIVQERIKEKFEIYLEPEIKIVGK